MTDSRAIASYSSPAGEESSGGCGSSVIASTSSSIGSSRPPCSLRMSMTAAICSGVGVNVALKTRSRSTGSAPRRRRRGGGFTEHRLAVHEPLHPDDFALEPHEVAGRVDRQDDLVRGRLELEDVFFLELADNLDTGNATFPIEIVVPGLRLRHPVKVSRPCVPVPRGGSPGWFTAGSLLVRQVRLEHAPPGTEVTIGAEVRYALPLSRSWRS